MKRTDKKIAILEEDAVIRDFYERLLSDAGYKTWYSKNGRETLHALSREDGDFDLLIMEPSLSHGDGWAIVNEIRESKGLQNLPILLVTAENIDGNEPVKSPSLFDGLILKQEFDIEVFRNAVDSLLADDYDEASVTDADTEDDRLNNSDFATPKHNFCN